MGNENESGKIGVGCQLWPKDTVNPLTNLEHCQSVGIVVVGVVVAELLQVLLQVHLQVLQIHWSTPGPPAGSSAAHQHSMQIECQRLGVKPIVYLLLLSQRTETQRLY